MQLIKTCGYTPWSYISLEVTIKGFATTGLQVPGNRNVGWKSEASTLSPHLTGAFEQLFERDP